MEAESKRSHWAAIEERGVFAGLRIMLSAYKLFGRAGFKILLFPVIGYFYLFGGEARRASKVFLARVYAFPNGQASLGGRPGRWHSFRHLLNFGDAVLDKLAAWAGEIRAEDFLFENQDAFEALRKSGRGGLLVASHLGNMEVCRALGQMSFDLKLNVLVHTKHAPNFNRLLNSVSPDSGVSLIQTTEVDPATAMMLHDRVSRGEFVVIVGDRTPVGRSARISWASFLNKPAPFPQGPFILAALLECPVQIIFCLKKAEGYRVVFEPFAASIKMPRGKREEILDGCVSRYAARLEHYCVRYPYQWFNFFDFWGQAGTMPPDRYKEF